jgi:hypothetical protein
MESIIEWQDENCGYLTERRYLTERQDSLYTRRYMIYSRRYCVRKAVDNYLHYLSRTPITIQEIMTGAPVTEPWYRSGDSISSSIMSAYPAFLLIDARWVRETIQRVVHDCIRSEMGSVINDDVHFMIKTSAVRDWSKNCCICLETDIGIFSKWYQTSIRKIIIFRPCGHSVCGHCFQFDVCPLCRSPIASYFEHQKPKWSMDVIERLTTEVCSQLGKII